MKLLGVGGSGEVPAKTVMLGSAISHGKRKEAGQYTTINYLDGVIRFHRTINNRGAGQTYSMQNRFNQHLDRLGSKCFTILDVMALIHHQDFRIDGCEALYPMPKDIVVNDDNPTCDWSVGSGTGKYLHLWFGHPEIALLPPD